MKKVLLVGNVACGKTTFAQVLNGLTPLYKKTQATEIINHTLETPGEYLEHRSLFRALIVSAVEVDVVLFLQDATQERFVFSPGHASAFPVPVIGVVTKIDVATPLQQALAQEHLLLAGVSQVFPISAITGAGMAELIGLLSGESLGERDELRI